jgi:hypothetical protein
MVTTLRAYQAELVLHAPLAFLGGEFPVLPEVVRFRFLIPVGPLVSLWLFLAFTRIGIGVGITGTLTLTSVIVLGTSVLIGRLVLLGLGLGRRVRLTSELTTSFPVPLVNLLNKILEVVEASVFIEMNHFILDSLRQSQIGSAMQSRCIRARMIVCRILLRPVPRTQTRDISPISGTRSFGTLQYTLVYPEIPSDLQICGSHPAFLF